MESSQDMNIRELCALCKTLPCCPEHCCDVKTVESQFFQWDSCKCSHCQSRRTNSHLEKGIGLAQQNADPSILIKATGNEEVKKIKKPKKNAKEVQPLPEKDKELHLPSEQIRATDGALIINYEVPLEEDDDKVVYSGGVKGIRALRQQRDQINTQIETDLEDSRNRFQKYEANQNPSVQEESKRSY